MFILTVAAMVTISSAVMMATPCDLDDFALGFSLGEGIIDHASELLDVEIVETEAGIVISMIIDEPRLARLKQQQRSTVGVTGCGICGTQSLEQFANLAPPRVDADTQFSHSAIRLGISSLHSSQHINHQVGAVHAAAWCDQDGNLKLAREDVGRHNALDKLIGALRSAQIEIGRGFVVISSRASYEMVIKAARAGCSTLVAVSAPTSLAIDRAMQANITLIGFARDDRHSVYSHAQRLLP